MNQSSPASAQASAVSWSAIGQPVGQRVDAAGEFALQKLEDFAFAVHVAAAVGRIGEILPALISGASSNSLSGSLAEAVGA